MDIHSPLCYVRVPDLLADWPWARKVNPLYKEVAAEGNVWLRSFLPFNLNSQHAFEGCVFGLCAALVVPEAPREQLRTCVDLLNLFFLIDECTDVEPASNVRVIVDAWIDALHNPGKPRPEGEIIVGEVVRQFWERGQRTATHQATKHFVAGFTAYLRSVVREAGVRDTIRLENIGVHSLCAMGELLLSIPDPLYYHPLLARMMELECEIVAIDNDVVSYNREQATGVGDFNVVTTTMHHDGLNLEDTIRFLAEQGADLEMQYLECHREFCAFLDGLGSPDETYAIRRYVDHMGNVRRGEWCWSFECGRYFGDRGSACAKTQMVPLIPKRMRDMCARGYQVDILLMEEELSKLPKT